MGTPTEALTPVEVRALDQQFNRQSTEEVLTWAWQRFGVSAGIGTSFQGAGLVMIDLAKAHIVGSPGEYAWGGAASTAFWCDPAEDMAVVLLTQLMPSSTYPIRRELRVLSYQAIVD